MEHHGHNPTQKFLCKRRYKCLCKYPFKYLYTASGQDVSGTKFHAWVRDHTHDHTPTQKVPLQAPIQVPVPVPMQAPVQVPVVPDAGGPNFHALVRDRMIIVQHVSALVSAHKVHVQASMQVPVQVPAMPVDLNFTLGCAIARSLFNTQVLVQAAAQRMSVDHNPTQKFLCKRLYKRLCKYLCKHLVQVPLKPVIVGGTVFYAWVRDCTITIHHHAP